MIIIIASVIIQSHDSSYMHYSEVYSFKNQFSIHSFPMHVHCICAIASRNFLF